MIIKRSINVDGNIAPEVYNLLHNLPDESLHNQFYGKGHPLAIYNQSLNRVTKAFKDVLDIFEKLNNPDEIPTSDFLKLLDFQKELLHSLHSHFDDCYQILKVTSPFPDIKNIPPKKLKNLERSLYSWLMHFKHPGIDYFVKNTENYRSFLGGIVNNIKHNQARLRGITVKMDYEQYIGYYVEVIGLNKGNISKIPDSKIHPLGTAFSFSRDLAFHFYNLYEISHYLKKSLVLSFQDLYNLEIAQVKFETGYINFEDIAKRISNLSMDFFLDEYSKPHPLIVFIENDNDKKLALKLDDSWYNPFIPEVIEVYWLFESDGITKYSAMPYFDYYLRNLPTKSIPKIFGENHFVD